MDQRTWGWAGGGKKTSPQRSSRQIGVAQSFFWIMGFLDSGRGCCKESWGFILPNTWLFFQSSSRLCIGKQERDHQQSLGPSDLLGTEAPEDPSKRLVIEGCRNNNTAKPNEPRVLTLISQPTFFLGSHRDRWTGILYFLTVSSRQGSSSYPTGLGSIFVLFLSLTWLLYIKYGGK